VGFIGVAAGIATVVMPGVTALVLLYVIAAWALVRGAFEIAMALQLRKQMTGEWLLALAGVLSVPFGILLFAFPGAGALALILWIGIWSTVLGVMLLALAFRLRGWGRTLEPAAS